MGVATSSALWYAVVALIPFGVWGGLAKMNSMFNAKLAKGQIPKVNGEYPPEKKFHLWWLLFSLLWAIPFLHHFLKTIPDLKDDLVKLISTNQEHFFARVGTATTNSTVTEAVAKKAVDTLSNGDLRSTIDQVKKDQTTSTEFGKLLTALDTAFTGAKVYATKGAIQPTSLAGLEYY